MRIFKLTNKKTGFTLVEALIASIVLVVTAVVFLDSLSQCSTLIETGSLSGIALNACRGKLEEIAHSDLSKIMVDYNGKGFAVSGPLGQTFPGAVVVTQVTGTNLYNIGVTVSWQQKGRAMFKSLQITLINKG
jgi:type II secretory pathway pseudopilin PulG